ncbi:MAG: NAD/NADP octopine/nopaline dehydrogenase family protein [Candidatus Handelsmanbacteria bacterium]|nr:NAD/NADP octopine/nopaline dehydrogenase family protein [Candidatus Handelsmanbacteria bacterium]
MAEKPIAVLGGGNTAFAVAARLTLQGRRVVLAEVPEFAAALEPIRADGAIHLRGVAGEGKAVLHRVTTDLGEALAEAELVLLIVPAYAHQPFAKACIPHLRPQHTVVLMPGTLGSLEWNHLLRQAGVEGLTLAEVDTAPYVCRKTAPDTATIWGVVKGLGLGVLSSTQTARVRALLEPLFPGVQTYPDVMACGLSAMNPVVHPAGVLMNAGRIEYSRGEFYFYEEGVSPAVARVIMQVDEERRRIGAALGYDLLPVHEAFHRAGFGPAGDLWAAIKGSWMLTRLKAPGSLESRWLTEDIPYGLAAWSRVGAQYGVKTPILHSLVELGSVVMGFDAWKEGRGVEELGLAGLDRTGLVKLLKE